MIDLAKRLRQLTQLLQKKQLKITTAESCTGGMLACLLTELPGSSDWFDRGFVTYSNLAKQEMLGVSFELIQSHGAVSQEVAEAMALGALETSAAHLSIATTGIAGPSGGSIHKPVGTVWIAFGLPQNMVHSFKAYFPDVSRPIFRQLTCHSALECAIALVNQGLPNRE